MSNAMIALVMAECQAPVAAVNTTEDKLRAAFKSARGHWIVLDENLQFKGALGAVLRDLGVDHPDHARLAAEIANVGKLSALISAAQAGLTVEPPEWDDTATPPFGILGLWHASKEPKDA